MERAIILTENGQSVFRYDVKPNNGHDDLEMDIAQFVVQLANNKGMVNSKYVVKKITRLAHLGLTNILDFFSEPSNIRLFMRELKSSGTEINRDLKQRFSRQNTIRCFMEALNEA